jgi:hypothetical protein
MRKIGLLCLALVLALGALGVGYAMWTDTITIHGTVQTGEVCFEFWENHWGQVVCDQIPGTNIYPDKNWSGWIPSASQLFRSCPPGYVFDDVYCVNKDVASVSFSPMQADGTPIDAEDLGIIPVEKLGVTIHNAYPHLAMDISFWVCNCGTVPIIIGEPEISQSDYLLIQYGDNIGTQLEPGGCVEISFIVGVVQHKGYEDASGAWIVDDETYPDSLTPQNNTEDLTFTIEIQAEQWAD